MIAIGHRVVGVRHPGQEKPCILIRQRGGRIEDLSFLICQDKGLVLKCGDGAGGIEDDPSNIRPNDQISYRL